MAGVINEVQAAVRGPSSAEPLDPARLSPQGMDRRQFVQTSVAGAIAGALGAWALSDESSWGSTRGLPAGREPRELPAPQPGLAAGRILLYAAVFDERFAAAVRFGAAAREQGLRIRGVRGDVTEFWYEELQPLWKQRALPLAGLTAYAALFCLERLAWDHRMRVIYHAAHTTLSNSDVGHVLALMRNAQAAPAASCVRGAAPVGGATLHSWVIAPPRRA
jgi:hypothetical protein